MHVPVCHSARRHLKYWARQHFLYVSYKLRGWSTWRLAAEAFNCFAGYKHFSTIWGHRLSSFQVSLSSLQRSFLYILIGTFAFFPSPAPSLPSTPLLSVRGQLGLCGERAVAVGGLGQSVAIPLELLSGGGGRVRPLRAGGAREQSQGASANEGEPVELGRHKQSSAEVTVPGHRQRNHVEGNGCVPGPKTGRRQKKLQGCKTCAHKPV